MNHKVLVVDDDPQILRTLRINLSAHGYRVVLAPDGAAALRAAADEQPDVIVLDLGLPDMDGTEVIAGMRGWTSVPIIVLTARTGAAETVKALDTGADDYVTKPFGMAELLARLRAAVRRATVLPVDGDAVVDAGDFVVDLAAKKVRRADDTEVHLTPTEWGVLELLVRHRGQARRAARAAARRLGAQLRVGDELPARLRRPAAAQARAPSRPTEAPDHRGGDGLPLRAVRDAGAVSLTEALRGWEPPTVELSRRVDPWSAAAFAALLDTAPPDGPLPPMWHWFTLLDHPAQSAIGADGHPAAGPFLPPIPGRKRMFAGGRLTQHAPIAFGAVLECRAAVADVVVKSGRNGEMAFVTTRYEMSVAGSPVAVEEQDIVYRSEPPGTPPRTLARPDGGEPEPPGAWRLRLATDPVLLARFSALTYNGHRIHYDSPYATGVEGYPDLVIHGPLLALLALELPRRSAPDAVVAEFAYRLVRPAFHPSRIVAAGSRDGDAAEFAVAAEGAGPSLTGTARFR